MCGEIESKEEKRSYRRITVDGKVKLRAGSRPAGGGGEDIGGSNFEEKGVGDKNLIRFWEDEIVERGRHRSIFVRLVAIRFGKSNKITTVFDGIHDGFPSDRRICGDVFLQAVGISPALGL
ncbi:hypothetical protein SUGI_1024930 [Cryptomeria japonica]|nr:hypothetical protein SUGI_1024930 [Cryptomeria japonica]